jgi:hypothetical protein
MSAELIKASLNNQQTNKRTHVQNAVRDHLSIDKELTDFLRNSFSWVIALHTCESEVPVSVRQVQTICRKQKQLDANSNQSGLQQMKRLTFMQILCFVERTSLYNLLNKANLAHNLF